MDGAPPKKPRKPRKKREGPPQPWGIDVNVIGPEGKPLYAPDGTLLKQRVQMGCGTLPDGCLQSLYYPRNHPVYPSGFKGMAEILVERGFRNAYDLRAQCPDFKCAEADAPGMRRYCCCRRILFEEPDFANVASKVEEMCEKRGVGVVFFAEVPL